MDVKEKADELIKKYRYTIHRYTDYDMYMFQVRRAAVVAIDEMLELLNHDLGHDSTARALAEEYEQVKQYLNEL